MRRLALFVLLITSTAQAEGDDKAERLAALIEPIMLAQALGPSALWGARVCEARALMATFEASNTQERQVGKESGFVDARLMHENGEAIVALTDELKAIEAKARDEKVKPAPCSSEVVTKILECEGTTCASLAGKQLDLVAGYSVPRRKVENEERIAKIRQLLAEKAPATLALLDARVEELLKLLGFKASSATPAVPPRTP